MNQLDKVLKNLEEICQQEKNKKIKKYNLKEEKEEIKDNDGGIRMFLKQKAQYEYRNSLRLKSKRNGKKKVCSEDFDEKYKEEQDNMFKQKWTKLTKVMRLNRVYRYMKIRKNELEWSIVEYEEKLELVKETLDLNGLRKDIDYDTEEGEIRNCWIIDDEIKEEN